MTSAFRVRGTNTAAPFTLAVYRGEGMALLGMNWRRGRPPADFVGFGIQYLSPGRTVPYNVTNRLSFRGVPLLRRRQPSMIAPIQKFRWVHFPFDADQPGLFEYVVTPVFMNPDDSLYYGEAQRAALELHSETLPGVLNLGFTRGFVSSQAFVDRFERDGAISTLLPTRADDGLQFIPTHPKAAKAFEWMGFEARRLILEVLDEAIADATTVVRVVGYELSNPEVVSRLEQLGSRLRIIIDDSVGHDAADSAESQAARRLAASAGVGNVIRQHMGQLQHNKTIVVSGNSVNRVVCGSTNFSWRGLYVQNNNAVVLSGAAAAKPFVDAFEQYWLGATAAFRRSSSTNWIDLASTGVKAKVTFSPHSSSTAVLASIGADMLRAQSSVLYSLAFLYQTTGPVREAVKTLTEGTSVFIAGIADRAVGGIAVQTPNGNVVPVFPAALSANVPAPFSREPAGGGGVRMHHKFVVIDFNKPAARVYFGSHNFSNPADNDNGENLLMVTDRRVATAYAIEAIRLFDHYEFRVKQLNNATAATELVLHKPPRRAGETPWFDEDYTVASKVRDRKLFA